MFDEDQGPAVIDGHEMPWSSAFFAGGHMVSGDHLPMWWHAPSGDPIFE